MSASRCFEIDVRRATILEPDGCLQGASTVPLATSFLLVGGSETPIRVHATANWQCNGSQLLTP